MSPNPRDATFRVIGLVVSGLLATFVALGLLFDSRLFATLHPLPLALAFLAIAGLCFWVALLARRHPG